MKNKVLIKVLCVSFIMIIVGGVITLAARLNGGELSITQSKHGIFNLVNWEHHSTDHNAHTNYDENVFTCKTNIEKFSADIDYGSFEIRRGNEFNIYTENIDKNKITVNEKKGVYHFNLKDDEIEVLGNNHAHAGKIYVTLPNSVHDISIKQSIGEIEIENMQLSTLSIDSKLGDVDLDNVTFDNGDISLNMGEFDFYGDFTNHLSIINQTGDADLHLMRYETQYNYDLTINVGDLHFDEHDHGSMNSSYIKDNQQSATLKAQLNMGSLEIEFTENHH